MIPKLTESLDFHSQALVLRAERQRVIAGNIANADTPGYKARDFDFATALRDASAARGGADTGGGSGIGAGIGAGIAQGVMQSGGQLPTALRYVQPVQSNLDNNTVDMDRERGAFMDNALKYDATLRFINANVRMTMDAMKSHNQG
jgi:flagellar basal-body rod protein FlgB